MKKFLDGIIFNVPCEGSYKKVDLDFISIETENGETVSAYFINRNAPFTILFCHGNAENIYMLYDYFEEVSMIWGVNIFVYDYLGYGESSGVASEKNMYLSGYAVYEYIVNKLRIDPDNLIVYGKSIGSCAAVDLASNRKFKGVILQSAIVSLFNICFKTRFIFPFDSFCNLHKLKKITCHIFFIHGTSDPIVPFYHGLQLYKKSNFKVNPYWVLNGKHNDLEIIDTCKFNQHITSFVNFLKNLQT